MDSRGTVDICAPADGVDAALVCAGMDGESMDPYGARMPISRSRALLVALLVLAVLVLGLAGLSPAATAAAQASPIPTVHITGKGRALPIARTHQVRIKLDTAADGGYSWAVSQRPKTAVATLGKATVVTPPAPPGSAGQPALTYYRITAKAVGTTVIKLVEWRSFDHTDVARRVTLTVIVPRYPAFYGNWSGHTRYLYIDRSGNGVEHYGSGCCDPLIDLTFRISNPRTVQGARVATITVVDVTVHKGWQESGLPAPHAGSHGTLRLRNGLLHEHLTGTYYCDAAQSARGACGA